MTADEVAKYVSLSEGFSLAHLREFIISTRVFKCDVDWAAQKLRAMMNAQLSSKTDENREFGFTGKAEGTKTASIHAMPKTTLGELESNEVVSNTKHYGNTSVTVSSGPGLKRSPGMGYIGPGISKF